MEWIKPKDKLPEREENVIYSQVSCLVYHEGEIKILVFNHEHLCWDGADGDDYYCDIAAVEFWQPLPNIPKKDL